jgi:quinolinate synthase
MATATIDMLLANYADLSAQELDERIARAKKELGSRLVILGHHYQRDEVVKFADYRGDSLRLSQLAARRRSTLFSAAYTSWRRAPTF